MKCVVITGGSRGIGFGMAGEFLMAGWNVVICGRNRDSLKKAVAKLVDIKYSGEILALACDVSRPNEVSDLYNKASEKFGTVDVWINNAGIANSKANMWELDEKDIDRVIDTNLKGTINGCSVAIKNMLKQGNGTIYNFEGFGSDGRITGGMSVYGSTKRAVRYLTRALQIELKESGLCIGTLSPGMVTTDLLLRDLEEMPEKERNRTVKVFNILADKPETVCPWLVRKIIANRKMRPKIAWLTGWKVFGRFMGAGVVKRKII